MPKITEYTAVTTPTDTDTLVVVQSGVTKKITLATLKAAGGFAAYVKNNMEGTTAPAVTDDTSKGYSAGSVWIDTTSSPMEAYRCADATAGAAVWLKTTLTIDELGTGALRTIDAATAENDVLVGGSSPFSWVKKTLAEFKTILGLGGTVPAPVAENDFIIAAGSPLDWAKKTLAEVKTILGWDTKADKVATSPAPAGYVAELDSSGNIVKSDKLSSEIPPAATAENDMLVAGSSPFPWLKKTLAEVRTLLGLDGATTKILVGGGTGTAPVWTEATGSGAPVRAVSPTLVTPVLGTPASGDLKNCTGATTTTKGVTVYSGSTKALAGTDTASAMTPADVKAVLDSRLPIENLIGVPGAMGFGVGICPPANLPDGMVGMPGYDQLGSDNYGNYVYKEGSVMIWVPRFYYRIGHASNPTYATYGVNSIDIKGIDTYPTTALANAAGYALHRAFIDGGVEKLGFFRDKYKCSKVANGSGYTAASIKNGLPLSSHADHNPFAGCTGGANYYYSAIDLAHRRDGVDGAVNASSIFFCSSQFMRSAIAMLSMAHGQAATSTANCAWYHATYNYPKGCNNGALKDIDDTTVVWESDGYGSCGKTGSAGYGGGAGNVFAKSTHNGQNCGSADDNGLMYEISIGLTCIASTKDIEAISQANPCEITITGHGLVDGDVMQTGTSITQADWVGLNDKVWPITKTGENTFTVAFDSSAFGTAYDAVADPGTCILGKFYAAKEATSMKNFTNGVAAATDHWGAPGVAAMMDRFAPPFGAGDTFAQRFGSGGNQVLSEATSGAGYLLSGLGLPKDADGMDATGTNLFGKDYCYVCVVNDMCLVVARSWGSATGAGVWNADFAAARGSSSDYVGFRAAAYHV